MRPRFWLLEQATRRPARLDKTNLKVRHIHCPVNSEHTATSGRLSRLSIIIPTRYVGDFVWTWFSEVLVGPRARDFMRKHRLTGYSLNRAKAKFHNPDYGTPPPLWEFKTLGWGGIAARASGVKLAESCAECGLLEYSIPDPSRLIDPKRWDGSDFFMVWPLPLYMFLSDRAGTLLRQVKFKGISVIPAEELKLHSSDTVAPGRLSHHMPLGRAKELGSALGIV